MNKSMQRTVFKYQLLRLFRLSFLGLTTVVVTSCGGGNDGGNDTPQKLDTTPPEVIAVTPPDNSTNIAITSSLTAVFSEAMLASSMNTSALSVSDGANVIGASTNYNELSKTLTWTPLQNLEYSTTYTATVSADVKDLASNPASQSFYWTFTTEDVPVTIPNAPVGVSVISKDSENVIGWNSTNGAQSYNVYWSTTPGVTKQNYDGRIVDATNPYAHTPLNNGTDYYYVITAVNIAGESATSDEIYGTPQAAGTPWEITTVDSNGIVGKHTAVDLDVAGFAHISYYDQSNSEVKYASNQSGAWVVASIGSANNEATALVLDSAGDAHVVYQSVSGDLIYATNKTGTWTTDTVDPGLYSEDVAIAVDSNDGIHISYFDTDGNELRYATNITGSWQIDIAVDGPVSGTHPAYATSIQLDSNNRAHISYYEISNNEIRYATNSSGAWINVSVDTIGIAAEATTSLAIDSNDHVHISYYDAQNDDIKYAHNAVGRWRRETAESSSVGVSHASLVLDANNAAHISYSSTAGLKYTSNRSGFWQNTVIDAGTAGQFNSFGLGSLHASYFDDINGDLKYATITIDLSRPAPVGLSVNPGDKQNSLSWEPVPAATSYKVYWSTSEFVSKSIGVAISSDTNTLEHMNISNGVRYYYVVTAIGPNGESSESNRVSAISGMSDPVAPAVVNTFPEDNSKGIGLNSTVKVSFSTAMDPTSLIDGSLILRANNITVTTATSYNAQTRILTIVPLETLAPETLYTATLSATARDINLNPIAAEVSWNFTTAPGAPTLAGEVGNTEVYLSWDPVPGAIYYTIKELNSGIGEYYTLMQAYNTSLIHDQYTTRSLGPLNGSNYTYVVTVTTASGESANSNTFSATPSSSIPKAPSIQGAAGNGEAGLDWGNAENATSYNIYRSSNSGGPYNLIQTTMSTQFTDTGLVNGTPYYYVLRSVNGITVSIFSKEVKVVPSGNAPSTPASLAATAGKGWAQLSWDPSANATQYAIYRNDTLVAIVPDTQYTHTRNNTYTTYYKVAAINEFGQSPFSDELLVTTDSTSPPMPSQLSAGIVNNQINLTWTDAIGAASYHLYRGTTTGVYPTDLGVQTSGYIDTSAVIGTNYFYVIDSISSSSATTRSNEVNIAVFDTLLPPPVNLIAISGNTEATLRWDPVTYATDYAIYSSSAQGGPYLLQGVTDTPNFTQSALNNSVNYYFVIRARQSGVEGEASAEVQLTPSSAVPTLPTSLFATAGNTEVSLGWTMISGTSRYNIYRRVAGEAWMLAGSSVQSPFNDTALTNGTTYYYAISAENTNGESAWSNQAVATALETVPVAPSNVTAFPGNGSVTITWDPVPGAISYQVLYSLSPGGPYQRIDFSSVSGPSYYHRNLINDRPYYYVVRANLYATYGAYSQEVSAIPSVVKPQAPSGVRAYSGINKISVKWSATSGANYYKLYKRTEQSNWVHIASPTQGFYEENEFSNEEYFFAVSAVGGGGEGAWSSEVTARPNDYYILPPTNLIATPGNGRVTLRWDAVSDDADYNVHWTSTPEGSSGVVTLSNGPTFIHTGLVNGTTYHYRVYSFVGQASGKFSDTVSVTPSESIPLSPSFIGSFEGNTETTLLWTPVPEATHYRIYRRSSSEQWSLIAEPTTSPFYDTGLINGVTYIYDVAAVTSNGEISLAVRSGGTPLDTSPRAPKGFSAIGGKGAVTLSWEPVPDATNYMIYIGPTANDGYAIYGFAGNVQTYTIPGLTNDTKYKFLVRATLERNLNHASSMSAEVEITPSFYSPFPPSGIANLAGNSEISLSWDSVAKATGYRIYRRTSDSAWFLVGTSDLSPFTDKGLNNGVPYYYRVTAVNKVGESTLSEETTGTALETDPMAPENATATAGDANVFLSWDPVAGATGYAIFQSTTQGGPYAFQAVVTGEEYFHEGLSNGTTYYYVISATIEGNTGAYSKEVSATPNL